jgi:hypothetical protein
VAYGAVLLRRSGKPPCVRIAHPPQPGVSPGNPRHQEGLAQFRPWGTCPENRGGARAPVWVRDPPLPRSKSWAGGSARLERFPDKEEIAGSNPARPTMAV